MVAILPSQQHSLPTKSNEWYTPSRYIEAARQVMGSIDLDPASCELANRTVQAKQYYTKRDNGLLQPWYGNIWLNPPYGFIHPEMKRSPNSWQKVFVEHALAKYEAGYVNQIILLLLGSTVFRTYFQSLWQYPVCLNPIQTKFTREDGSTSQFGFGSIFVYLGPNEQKFINTFSQFGRIARAIDTPKQPQTPPTLWEVQ
jgi:hypothetical protein